MKNAVVNVRECKSGDLLQFMRIWNQVVEEGRAFPQSSPLTESSAAEFFESQSFCAAAEDEGGNIIGMYILHPNNVGRCGHIANASFAVSKSCRGRGVGEALVRHCLETAALLGFRILQFNAVVASNTAAQRLYERFGFTRLGVIPGGFKNASGEYEDIFVYYINLKTDKK